MDSRSNGKIQLTKLVSVIGENYLKNMQQDDVMYLFHHFID